MLHAELMKTNHEDEGAASRARLEDSGRVHYSSI